jgi:hypothetical protein
MRLPQSSGPFLVPVRLRLVGTSAIFEMPRRKMLYRINRRYGAYVSSPPYPAYLTDIIEKLQNGWPKTRLDEILPDCWQPGLTR